MCSLRAAEHGRLGVPRAGPEACNPRGCMAVRATALASACALALVISAGPAQARTTYFRSASSAATSSASSIALNAPAGLSVGDLLVMNVDANGGNTAFTAPTGWTGVSASENYASDALGGGYSILAYKEIKSTSEAEVASYTIELKKARAAVARIVDYVGVKAGAPFENTIPAEPLGTNPSGGTNTTSFSYPSVTTTAPGTVIIFGAVAFPTAGDTTITPPSGSTSRVSLSGGSASPYITTEITDQVQAADGTVAEKGKIAASSPWGAGTIALTPSGSGTLQFTTAPSAPTLGVVTLNGQARTVNATMNNFAVEDTSGESGWNVTVEGQAGTGKSPVFKEYCENGASACEQNGAKTYGGHELPAESLKLKTSSASWSTSYGVGQPEFKCSTSSCALDSATAMKIVSAPAKSGLGPWTASGFGSSSLALALPSTLRALPAHEIYRVNLLWSLSTGP
jgi:hypothetical protein